MLRTAFGLVLATLCLVPDLSASEDTELARKVRTAVGSSVSGRLVSREDLNARPKGRSDLDLARAASTAIQQGLGDRMRGLLVSADDGMVELRGQARDATAAQEALALALAVPGVYGVRSTLMGDEIVLPAVDPSAPFAIATSELLGGAGLQIRVQRGRVRISGTVNGQAARRHVIAAARSVRGVRVVTDELKVQETSVNYDLGLLGVLRYKLANVPEVRPLLDDLKLQIRSGVVRLSGTVDSDEQRDLVEALVLFTTGVHVVVSEVDLASRVADRAIAQS